MTLNKTASNRQMFATDPKQMFCFIVLLPAKRSLGALLIMKRREIREIIYSFTQKICLFLPTFPYIFTIVSPYKIRLATKHD